MGEFSLCIGSRNSGEIRKDSGEKVGKEVTVALSGRRYPTDVSFKKLQEQV